MTWILSNKRLTAIIVLCLVIFGQLAYANYLAGELREFKLNAEKEKVQAIIDAIEKIKPIEIKYTIEKVAHDEKTIEVVKHATKILKEPYYIDRECFNNEFVSLYNGYINSDTAKPINAVQESAKP